jgi:hypothetical protein
MQKYEKQEKDDSCTFVEKSATRIKKLVASVKKLLVAHFFRKV